jgi:hypothetical protein
MQFNPFAGADRRLRSAVAVDIAVLAWLTSWA